MVLTFASKHQNHEEICANFCGLPRKAELDSTKKGLGFPLLSTYWNWNQYSFENYKLLDQPFCDMMVTISFFLNPNSSSSFRSKSKMAWFFYEFDWLTWLRLWVLNIYGNDKYATIGLVPSSIYSCSIGHIWEHEFCHLGCWAVKEKFWNDRISA